MALIDTRHSGPDPEDRKLVEKFLRRRQEKVFRAIYQRHTPAIYQILVRMLRGDASNAEEVLQVAWVRAIERLETFRWESSLRSWLIGIALNCSREFLRRQRRTEPAEPWAVDELPALRRAAGELNRIDLERAIAHLPDGYREVLILHDIEGYTHNEIGEFLGIETGTSKSQLSRARRAMRARLSDVGSVQNG